MFNLTLSCIRVSSLAVSPLISKHIALSTCNSQFSNLFNSAFFNPARISARSSRFLHVLGSSIYLSMDCSITNDDFAHFEGCDFIDCHTVSNGAAIFDNSSRTMAIIRCSFTNCTSLDEGGAVYKKHSSFQGMNNCFMRCYIDRRKNDCLGNAMCIDTADVLFNYSVHVLCGVSTEQNGDTPIGLYRATCTNQFNNYTHCYGYGGMLSVSYNRGKALAHCKNEHISQSGSHGILETRDGQTEYSSLVIVNNTKISYYFYFLRSTCDVIDSVFWGNSLTKIAYYQGTSEASFIRTTFYPQFLDLPVGSPEMPHVTNVLVKEPQCAILMSETYTASIRLERVIKSVFLTYLLASF